MPALRTDGTRPVLLLLFLAYLVLQISLPIMQLQGDPPVRLGWQMFSVPTPAPEFVVILSDGTRADVDLGDYVAFPRGDLPLVEVLPLHLCRVVPGAAAVLVGDRVVPCL